MNKIKKVLLLFSFTLVSVINPGCKKITDSPPVVTTDTTTHNYEWTVSTFGTGAGSSYLYDVFAISENDIWAVGKITTNEQDSSGNDLDPYNAIHWDGENWEKMRIPAKAASGSISPHPLNAVFVFSSDNVWTFSQFGAYSHWNGNNWTTEFVSERYGTIRKIWGSSTNNIYFVGTDGNITHYNGSDWTKLDSSTDLRLTDIWGFSDGNFAMVGSNSATNENIFIVNKDGNLTQFEYATNRKKGIWGTSINDIYAVGAGLFHFNGDTLTMVEWPNHIPQIFVESIRGTANNNIFASGHFSFIMHYNGQSWYYYNELYGDANLYAINVLEDEVFAVGADGYSAYVYHGKKITN